MAGQLLSNIDRRMLEEYSQTTSGVQQRRAQLILLYDDGLLTHQVAEQVGLSRSQARFWKHKFTIEGMTIFPGLSVETRKIDVTQDAAITSHAEKEAENRGTTEEQCMVELPFPEVMKRSGLLPNDTLAEAGRKTWLFLFAEMVRNEEPTRSGEDIEGLHDMRVATRRMRSAVDVFGRAFTSKIIKRHVKGLRATGRALGRVRDMDVLIEKLLNYSFRIKDTQQEGLIPLINAWKWEREIGRQTLIAYLDSQEFIQFKHGFNHFVQNPGESVWQCKKPIPKANLVCEVVPVIIYKRMGAVRAYSSILQNASDTQLHALRIEFKKLRYAVEYFREVLDEEATSVIQDLKSMQDHLGDFHDAVVACDLVTSFLIDWEKSQLDKPLQERQNPEPIVSYLAHLHAERHRLLVTLPDAWSHFNRPEFRLKLAKAISIL